MRDVEIVSPGGGTKKDTAADVPESEADYPENRMFGNIPLPAFGLYVRHADEVVLERVRFSLAPGSADARPPVAADDSTMFRR